MESSEKIASMLLALMSVGLGVIAFVSKELRLIAGLLLLFFLFFAFLYLKLQQLTESVAQSSQQVQDIRLQVNRFEERLDLHKKVYKLEQLVRKLMRNRHAKFDPTIGAIIVAVLIFLFILFKALGLF